MVSEWLERYDLRALAKKEYGWTIDILAGLRMSVPKSGVTGTGLLEISSRDSGCCAAVSVPVSRYPKYATVMTCILRSASRSRLR